MLSNPSDPSSIKIIDFGLMAEADNVSGGKRGTLYFASPEIFVKDFSKVDVRQADMWSLGLLMYSMMENEFFVDFIFDKLKQALIDEGMNQAFPKTIEKVLKSFLIDPQCTGVIPLLGMTDYYKLEEVIHPQIANRLRDKEDPDNGLIGSLCLALLKREGERMTADDVMRDIDRSFFSHS